MIGKVEFEDKIIRLHDGELSPSSNSYTVIVGKNGSGKSRFLRHITQECMKERLAPEMTSPFPELECFPTNIIASSSSPFDRFPINSFSNMPRGDQYVDESQGYYFYQGLRGLFSPNLSMSFMVRIIAAVLRALTSDTERLGTVMEVLSYLGYEREMNIKLTSAITKATLVKIAEQGDFSAYQNQTRNIGLDVKRLVSRLAEEPQENTKEVIEAIRYFVSIGTNRPLEFPISIENERMTDLIDEKIITLMEYGVLRLRYLSLTKPGIRRQVRLNEASSGEQCVVLTMLGIAARIQDGSLICIDEPEICLHPEWQERYIQLLMSTFQGFKSCQFIIATHSPQIVSRLGNENCYVLDLQNNSLQRAEAFNRRSIDFQLAQVFNAPGFKNEYLMREILGIVAILSAGKSLTPSQQDFMQDLRALKDSLSIDDPVLQLFKLVEEALKTQGARSE